MGRTPQPREVFTEADLEAIELRGIGIEEAMRQIALLTSPPRFQRLDRPCTIGDGIAALSDAQIARALTFQREAAAAGRCRHFIPASGAATRMFADLLHYCSRAGSVDAEEVEDDLRGPDRERAKTLRTVLDNIDRFAFAHDLRVRLAARGADLADLIQNGSYRPILDALLGDEGLGLAALPKGLLPFHRTDDGVRTAFEEHLQDVLDLSQDVAGTARLHFTISREHLDRFDALLEAAVRKRGDSDRGRVEVEFSSQDPSTDTLSVDAGGRPVRRPDGTLLFRPGGHGALLANLATSGDDILLVKNIDNVAVESRKAPCRHWSGILVGHLVDIQSRTHAMLRRLEDPADAAAPQEAATLAAELLPGCGQAPADRSTAIDRLDRPLRVCAMIPNTGEPGGGPYWVRDPKGGTTPQVVERAHVDPMSASQQEIFATGTHFNPVLMALGLRDHRGKPYDLRRYADQDAVLVTEKTAQGRSIRVLERPGLWNGAMAGWNTIFIDVPLDVFTPAKTILDLLRVEHQSS